MNHNYLSLNFFENAPRKTLNQLFFYFLIHLTIRVISNDMSLITF